MNLIKKKREFKIGDKEYLMTFDMKSIATYKEMTGKSFVTGADKLYKYDDEEIINFIGSTLREKENPNKPIGKEIYNMDILYFLLNHTTDVIILVADSMPSSKGKK